jgi:hypothetical protein
MCGVAVTMHEGDRTQTNPIIKYRLQLGANSLNIEKLLTPLFECCNVPLPQLTIRIAFLAT